MAKKFQDHQHHHTPDASNSNFAYLCKFGDSFQICKFLQYWTYIFSMIKRLLLQETLQTAKEFKAVCITGPGQSGKTTLVKLAFLQKAYIRLEDPDTA
jgi:phage/plasmid-associated DNA primase